jgi:hypothetical protein
MRERERERLHAAKEERLQQHSGRGRAKTRAVASCGLAEAALSASKLHRCSASRAGGGREEGVMPATAQGGREEARAAVGRGRRQLASASAPRICASDPGLREGEDDARSHGEEGG